MESRGCYYNVFKKKYMWINSLVSVLWVTIFPFVELDEFVFLFHFNNTPLDMLIRSSATSIRQLLGLISWLRKFNLKTGFSLYRSGTQLVKKGFRVLVLRFIVVLIAVFLYMMSTPQNHSRISTTGGKSFWSRQVLRIQRTFPLLLSVIRSMWMVEAAGWYQRRRLELGVLRKETFHTMKPQLK